MSASPSANTKSFTLLASNAGQYVIYRAIWHDRLHYEGFVGRHRLPRTANVRSAPASASETG